MEPFGILGVAASIITCVQLTGALLKRVGPSDHSKKDLNEILKAILGFRGAYENLKTSLQLNEEDASRLSALQHLEAPLRDSKRVLDLLEKRLESPNFLGQYIVGVLWDAKFKRSLKILQDTKTLFEIALDADQHIILSAVERYVRNVAEDVRDLATHINENGKRLLDLDEHSQEQSKRVMAWNAETKTSLHRIEHDVTEHREKWSDEAKKKEKDKIFRWLSSTDPTINQNAAWESHEPQTGKWFIGGKEYLHWKETPRSFLWIHGIAGCGKTVLSATIIRDLMDYCNAHCTFDSNNKPTHSLAYFYCSFTDMKKQNSLNLISSLVAQIVKTLPSVSSTLSNMHDQHRKENFSVDDMKVEFESILKLSGQTFLVIDALDECPNGDIDNNRTKVLALLIELSGWALPNLHILVTSRREPDIDKALTSLENLSSISIQTHQVQPDIHKYIKSQLANDLELKKWSSLIKEEIENTLVEQAHGMFRWVFCQIESLKRCLRLRDVRDALKSLPKTLDDFYARTLLGIDESYRRMTINAVQWLAFSKRPLCIEELADAVLIDPQATPSFDQTERLFDSRDILKVLSSLVTVYTRKKNGLKIEEIRLAHFSVKEYLISNRPKPTKLSHFFATEVNADQLIAESCLLYMKTFTELEDRRLIRTKLIEAPLMLYACRHWRDHVRGVHFESSKAFAELVFELFNSKSKSKANLLILNSENPAYEHGSEWSVSCESGPESLFHNACCLSLDHTVQQLLKFDPHVHLQSRYFGTTLQEVAKRGHETIVNRFLKAGADVNILSGHYVTALQAAAEQGHETIVDRLLKAGADVNILSGHYGTALQAAAEQGHETIVDRLLEAGADVNLKSGYYGTALQAAAEQGHETIVDKLLRAEADVNISCENGTVLYIPVVNGHVSVMDSYLKKSPGHYGTALQAAAANGHETILNRLLKAGADVNISSGCYGTALQFTAAKGYETVVKAGADVNIKSGNYGTALQVAAAQGYETVVDRLLEAGANVKILSGQYGNALQTATEKGYETIVNSLLEAGADVDLKTGNYGTALQAAAANAYGTIVDRLLEAAADVNIRSRNHSTALQMATQNGHVAIADRLVKAGAR